MNTGQIEVNFTILLSMIFNFYSCIVWIGNVFVARNDINKSAMQLNSVSSGCATVCDGALDGSSYCATLCALALGASSGNLRITLRSVMVLRHEERR